MPHTTKDNLDCEGFYSENPMRRRTAGKETLRALKDIALRRTKERFGLPEEWNEVQCLVSLSKEEAETFTEEMLKQIEIVANRFAEERERRR